MQTLNFLGRGSAFNYKEGNTSAYIIRDKHLILIDCGENIYQKIKEINLLDGIEKITVLVTHLNSDHIGSLSTLIYDAYYLKGITPEILSPTREISMVLISMGHKNEFKQEVVDKLWTIAEGVHVKPIITEHIKGMDCFGYLFRIDFKTIYYSGDAKSIPEKVYELFNIGGIDELYQDVSSAHYEGNVHMSLQDLNKAISKESRNKVFCMHIDEKIDVDNLKELGYNIVEVRKGGN